MKRTERRMKRGQLQFRCALPHFCLSAEGLVTGLVIISAWIIIVPSPSPQSIYKHRVHRTLYQNFEVFSDPTRRRWRRGAHNLPVCGMSDGAGEGGRWFIYAVRAC